jgi:hypothetical protein
MTGAQFVARIRLRARFTAALGCSARISVNPSASNTGPRHATKPG